LGAEKPATERSLLSEFGSSAFDAGFQRPVNGISQLAGSLVGRTLPELHLVAPDKPNDRTEAFVQQAGASVGMIVPFLISRAVVRGAFAGRLGTSITSSAIEGGATGAFMGAVLTPLEKGRDFWQGRLANTVTDAGTFAVLGASARWLSGIRAFALTPESGLLSTVGKGAGIGAISGIPAGLASAELLSLSNGRGLASQHELGKSVTDFAMFGGILGGIGGAASHYRHHRAGSVPLSLNLDSPKAPPVKVQAEMAQTQSLLLAKIEQPKVEQVRGEPSRGPLDKVEPTKRPQEKSISFDKRNLLGEGDEGKVYSNNDGTVTKVFFDRAADMNAVKSMYERLQSIGVRTPKILETGKTKDGNPALRMEQIGDGDNLQFQLIAGELSRADMLALRKQYYAFGDAIAGSGIRIDWQLKNMRFEDGKLYILDPSFLKQEPMSPLTINRYGQAIGPRP
jgi:hypothetical protein